MKPYQPFPMMMRFRQHQGIEKGGIITENVGGVDVQYKVTEIKSFRSIPHPVDVVHEVILMVRELPLKEDPGVRGALARSIEREII